MARYQQSEYSKLLRDPRWQKKRLEILQRDEFKCVSCAQKEKTLHVHHCFYQTGKKPWEYPDTSLVTLCEECHEVETAHLNSTKKELCDSIARHGAFHDDYEHLANAFLSGELVHINLFYYLALFIGNLLSSEDKQKSFMQEMQRRSVDGEL